MKKEKFFEIFFTTDNVTEDTWLKFLLYISKLNGRFRKWKIFIRFEKNNVKYFIKTKKDIPTTLSDLGDFLIKKTDEFNENKKIFSMPYFITNKEKTVVDIYDRNESKKNRILNETSVTILPYKLNNYLSFTNLFFLKNNKIIKRRAFFNIPHIFLNIDFSKHTRFLYKKDIKKYLNIEKSLNLFESDNKNGILKIDAFPYFQDDYFLNLNNYDFDKHSLIIGGSGTGKSKLISLLINNIYKNPNYKMKYKVVVIDPHSSLEEDIGGFENTKVIDFKKEKNSIDLFMNSRDNVVSESEILLSLFKSLMAKEYNSKLERVLRHSIFLLICVQKVNLKNLRRLITENEFRNNLLRKNKEILPEPVLNFFLKDFTELKNKSHQEAISPIIAFIDEMTILPAFNTEKKLKNLEDTIKENFLSIISLSETSIGEKATKTISGLVMGQLFTLMQKRNIEEHIILVVDEVAVIQNPILKRFLAESRKYNLSVILSGQYFNQIEEDLQKAIFANVINYYTFRVSREDAIILSRNMLMELAVHDSHFAKVKMLSELANRECVVRASRGGKVIPAFKAKTLDVISYPRIEVEEEKCEKSTLEKSKVQISKFSIGNVDLNEIMKSQSTGRRKIVNEG
jgi:hypothetical protein